MSYYVYILTNRAGTVLYTGVTRDLEGRTFQHKDKRVPGFTSNYNVNRLVYYEVLDDPVSAIAREKQIKAGSRAQKLRLINALNPRWLDLYQEA